MQSMIYKTDDVNILKRSNIEYSLQTLYDLIKYNNMTNTICHEYHKNNNINKIKKIPSLLNLLNNNVNVILLKIIDNIMYFNELTILELCAIVDQTKIYSNIINILFIVFCSKVSITTLRKFYKMFENKIYINYIDEYYLLSSRYISKINNNNKIIDTIFKNMNFENLMPLIQSPIKNVLNNDRIKLKLDTINWILKDLAYDITKITPNTLESFVAICRKHTLSAKIFLKSAPYLDHYNRNYKIFINDIRFVNYLLKNNYKERLIKQKIIIQACVYGYDIELKNLLVEQVYGEKDLIKCIVKLLYAGRTDMVLKVMGHIIENNLYHILPVELIFLINKIFTNIQYPYFNNEVMEQNKLILLLIKTNNKQLFFSLGFNISHLKTIHYDEIYKQQRLNCMLYFTINDTKYQRAIIKYASLKSRSKVINNDN